MRRLALLMAVIAAVVAAPAIAAGRVALVIGNAHYAQAVGPLANPIRDADLVAAALRRRGFVVTAVNDASRVSLLAAVDRYARALAAAGPDAIGFLYYSGHGVANPDSRRNYVVPVDVASAADDRLWYESVPLDDLVGTITRTARGATNLIVFDACRDQLALPRGRGLGGGKGLERVDAPDSTLIAYSTAPGRTAADADATAATGPYATELAKALASDGVDARQMFEEVKFGVLARTGRRQQPWVEDGLAERVWIGARGETASSFVATSAPQVQGKTPGALPAESVFRVALRRWGVTAEDLTSQGIYAIARKIDLTSRVKEAQGAAKSGDPVASLLLGMAYFGGLSVEKDYALAGDWYRKAADARVPGAPSLLATMYLYGLGGFAKDPQRGLELLHSAAEAGESSAFVGLGNAYAGGIGTPKDAAQAMTWYRRAADAGNAAGMGGIGWLYETGNGVAKDHAQALQWYRRAYDTDKYETAYSFNIGYLYSADGPGVQKDYAKALEWYRLAASQGEGFAMTEIGSMYRNGSGLPQDYSQAMQWFRRAADTGNAKAMNQIGGLYIQGRGVSADCKEAMQWFRRSAEAGSAAGMHNLGGLYEDGCGSTPTDRATALDWYRKAAAAGDSDAIAALKRLGE